MPQFEVIVGNVGSVYRGTDGAEARKTYDEYVAWSQTDRGRAGGEDVTLFRDGEILREYSGSLVDGTTRDSKKRRQPYAR